MNTTTSQLDFTIKGNDNLRSFFEEDGDHVPVSEMVYTHNHPLLRPNFLTEINDLAELAGDIILAKSITGKILEDYCMFAVRISSSFPNVTYETAETLMVELRNLYKLCNQIIKANDDDKPSG